MRTSEQNTEKGAASGLRQSLVLPIANQVYIQAPHAYGGTQRVHPRVWGVTCVRGSIVTLLLGTALVCLSPASARCDELHNFICGSYENGAVPFEKAREFGSEHWREFSEAYLEAALKGRSSGHEVVEERCLPGAALTLGAIGSERAVETLKTFIFEGEGTLTLGQYKGKSSAILALGWAANSSNALAKSNESALQFLLSYGSDPNFWRQRIHWHAPPELGPHDLSAYLVRRSLQAIGLSGRQDAREMVKAEPICRDPKSRFKNECEDALRFIDSTTGGLARLYP